MSDRHDTTPSANGEDDPAEDVQYPPDTLPDLTTRVGRIDSELDAVIDLLRGIRLTQEAQAETLRRLEGALNQLARTQADMAQFIYDRMAEGQP